MFKLIDEIRNADGKKKRFLSALTAAFMTFTTLGSALSVSADRADSISEIENVTGNAAKKAELLDVPDAEDKFLGMAGDFTIFVKEKFTIPLDSADIEGRVAAGGGIENERGTYDIGSKYSGDGATVIVGGGKVEKILTSPAKGATRRIFAVTSDTDIDKDDYSQHLDNFYIADDLIDFDKEFQKIEQLSDEIKGYKETGELKEEWGSYKLIGTEDGVNVFNIPEDKWEAFAGANFIQIYVPGDIMDQYVFINVPGSGDVAMPHYSLEIVQYEMGDDGNPVTDEGGQIKVLDKKNVQQDSRNEDGSFNDNMLLCGHVLYNIPDAENVEYTGSIQGSVLAPNANVSGKLGGHVSGSTIAKSAEAFGIQAGSVTFNPPKKVVKPVPEEPVREISISKKEITGGPEIPGAVLKITAKDENADLSEVKSPDNTIETEKNSVTFTSKDKATTIKGLPDGDYELTEFTSPDGYTVNAETVSFTITDGKTETPAEMIDAPTVVTIGKVEVVNEKELPGATLILTLENSTKTTGAKLDGVKTTGDAKFELEDSDTSIKWVSTSTPAKFTYLPDGEYRLREIAAPDGYTITGDVKFKLTDGVAELISSTAPEKNDSTVDSKTNTIIMKDEVEEVKKPESSILVSKKAINGTEELPGAGLTITLVKPEASLLEVTVENGLDAVSSDKTVKFTSGKTAAVVKGLPDGDYTLTETTAPDGYTVNNETINFSIKDGKLTSGDEVEMLDKPSVISVSKMEVNGSAEIPGAELKLTLVKPELQTATLESQVNNTVKAADTDGMAVKWTSGTKPVVLTGLPDGEYLLEETTAPDGYLVTESISFSIKDGVLQSDDENVDSEGNSIVMRDEVSSISISKRDINDSEELPGATLKITQNEGDTDLLGVKVEASSGNPTITEKEITFVSGDKETVIKKLPDGKYTLTEITSPDGYTINKESVKFEVINGETVNSSAVKMLDRPSSVTFSKADAAGEEIPGAELTLELLKPSKTEKATLESQVSDTVKAANSDKTAVKWTSGTTPVVLSELPDGDYQLSETVVPDKYQVTDSIKFTLKDGKVVGVNDDKITMIDKLSEVTVSKKAINGTEELPGAKLTIELKEAAEKGASLKDIKAGGGAVSPESSDTKVVFTSGEKPAVITGLPDGKYTLTETTSPDGYTVNNETISFEVENGVLVSGTEVEMIDKPSEVDISKKAAGGSEEVPGAKLKLTLVKPSKNEKATLEDAAKKTANSSVTVSADSKNAIVWTSTDAPVRIKGLPDGEYKLEESVAPDGYTITDAVEFVIENGVVKSDKDNMVEMFDELSKVTISKQTVAGDELPGAELTLTIKEDKSLAGVTSDSKITAAKSSIKWTSGKKPVVLEGIPDGTYTLTESQAPLGYDIAESITFTVKNGAVTGYPDGKVVMTDGEKAPGEVVVSKKAINGTEELPGAKLTIELKEAAEKGASLKDIKAGGGAVSPESSDTKIVFTSGEKAAVITGLPDGKYTLTETTSPDGYTVNNETISFEVKNGVLVSGTEVEMIDKPSEVDISKKAAGGSEEVPGAKLKLTLVKPSKNEKATLEDAAKKTANSAVTVSSDSKNAIVWTSTDAPVRIKGLPDGEYKLEESVAPDGYTITDAVEFVIENGVVKSDKDNMVEMFDELSKVTISKQTVAGAELPGAELTLTIKEDKSLAGVTSKSKITAAKSSIKWTSSDKPVVLEGIPDGTYTLTEDQAPLGYDIAESITFTVKNGVVTGYPDGKVVMTDVEKVPSKIVVSKKAINGTEELPGAKLTIELKKAAEKDASLKNIEAGGGAVSPVSSDTKVVFTSGEKPAVITGLPDGKYTLTETTSPDGYTVNNETISFEVENGVLVSGTEVEMIDKPSEVDISKKAAGGSEEVPGAKLKLTLEKASKTSDATLEDAVKKTANNAVTLSTDSKRTVVWTSTDAPVRIKGLPDGEYKLEESVAPDGYTITGAVEFVIENGVVKSDDDNMVEMFDELSKVTISKQTVAGEELPGAELTLTIKEDKSLAGVTSKSKITAAKSSIKWTSGDKPAVLEGIPDGTYTLTENQAPLGYDIAESITFTVKNGEVTDYPDGKIIMTDVEKVPSEVVISKTEITGKKEIKGAHLKLTALDKNADLKKVTASSDAEILASAISWVSTEKPLVLKGLPDGEYLLEESIAPDGYKVTDSIKFTLKDGVTDSEIKNQIVMKDAPSEVMISKREINGTDEIPGAKLTVKLVTPVSNSATLENVEAAGNVTLTKTADSVSFVSGDKPVLIKGLPDGKYELIETTSPDGYTINTESVTFTVKNAELVSDSGAVAMIDAPSKISVSKMDMAMSAEITGAELRLTLKQGYKDTAADLKSVAEKNSAVKLVEGSDNKAITWKSGSKATVIEGLPDGEYVLEENVAPDRFTKFTGSIKFNIEDGVITADTSKAPKANEGRVDADNNRVIMLDEFSEISVSKTDVAGSEIAGAELKITSADKKDLSAVTSETIKIKAEGSSVSWTSEAGKKAVLRGLPDGRYIIEETQAPAGYKLTESAEFTITNGIPSQASVVMIDEYSEVKISKTDVAGSEIEGAKLTLTVTDNKTPLTDVKVTGGASDIVKSADSLSFTSGSEGTVITAIPDGKYVLTETQAPEGYEIAESVSFTVENGVVKEAEDGVITMVDALKPVVTTAVTTTVTTAVTTTVTTEVTTTVTTPEETTAATTVTTPEETTVATTVTTPEETTVTTTEATTEATTVTTPEETTVATTTTTTEATTVETTITAPELEITMSPVVSAVPVTDVTLAVTTTEETTVETTEATTTEETTEETTEATTTEETTTEATTEATTEETTAETTEETTLPETTPAEVTTTEAPKLTAKTVSSTPSTGDGRSTAVAMVFMAGSAAAMAFALKKKNK